LRNSIVARSPSGGNCFGTITTVGTNLSDTSECFGGSPGGNIVAADVGLAPLAINSPGTTATHALLPGSPAIDGVTGSPSECTSVAPTDQRGVARPQAVAGAARCDIGAFEVRHVAPTISSIDDQSTGRDGSTPTVPFTVGSTEVPPNSLTVMATSSNEGLVPNANIQLSGSGTARAIKVTATPHQSGEATITVTVSDGTAEARETFKVTVLAVNQAPTAATDSYSVAAGQTLIVPAASGVLANDTDAESSSLQAEVVTGPAHGTLDLRPDGGFTYTPTAGFAGTDTFTYRASDGAAVSSPATVTITVSAAPTAAPSRCAPRATVNVTTAVVGGKLQATVEALPLDSRTNNRLKELRFGALQNGKVTIGGQQIANGATYTVPGVTTQVVFTVERAVPGQPTTVPIIAVDECGEWPSFVGGGASAGF
jgi:VCBS repeat-containing protein